MHQFMKGRTDYSTYFGLGEPYGNMKSLINISAKNTEASAVGIFKYVHVKIQIQNLNMKTENKYNIYIQCNGLNTNNQFHISRISNQSVTITLHELAATKRLVMKSVYTN